MTSAVNEASAKIAHRRSSVWHRFRADPVAVTAATVLLLVIAACLVGEPVAAHFLGHGPDDIFPHAVNPLNLKPIHPWSSVPAISTLDPVDASTPSTFFILGADGSLGRDEFLRLLAGGRVSLEIACLAGAIALSVGTALGALAGYFGGIVDSVVSRLTEFAMAFPLLLLIIAVGQTIAQRFDFITLHGVFARGVLSIGCVIGAFTWFYPARIVRAEVLTLRNQEFVEAARMVGHSELSILTRHIAPHLTTPLAVWGALIVANNIVLEAALSFLNLGVKLPTASWGNMLSANWGTLLVFNPAPNYGVQSNWTIAIPTAAVAVTVLALALVGEGLRAATNPTGEG
jgi:peptide/nickel transport system permease protein